MAHGTTCVSEANPSLNVSCVPFAQAGSDAIAPLEGIHVAEDDAVPELEMKIAVPVTDALPVSVRTGGDEKSASAIGR